MWPSVYSLRLDIEITYSSKTPCKKNMKEHSYNFQRAVVDNTHAPCKVFSETKYSTGNLFMAY